MTRTRTASAPTWSSAAAPSTVPSRAPTTTTHQATRALTSPAGIGLPGLRPASSRASWMSLSAPTEIWSAVIDTPRPSDRTGSAPAATATAATTNPSSSDGNGWTRRTTAAARASGPSDVDELVEVLDQVVDQAFAGIGGVRADPRHQGVQRHGGHHLPALRIAPDHGRRAVAGSEHPFDITFGEARRTTQVVEHPDHAATLGDVPHH